jgi:hypothetical protein
MKQTDKAKPRVIVGRLLTINGGGPTAPREMRWGKPRVPGHWDSRVAEGSRRPDYRGLSSDRESGLLV